MLELRNDPPDNSPTTSTESQGKGPAKLLLEDFLRREELAEQLGLSPRTIDRWHALRLGPPRVCVGRTILYSVQSVREWLRRRENQVAVPQKRRR